MTPFDNNFLWQFLVTIFDDNLDFLYVCCGRLDCPFTCSTDQNIKKEGCKWLSHCSQRTGAAGNPASSPNISGWCESPGKGVLYRTSSPHIKTWNRVVLILGTKLTELPQETFQKLLDDPIQNTRQNTSPNQYKVCPQSWPINLEIQHWYCYLYWHKVIYSHRESGLF